jgi:hypothetical protein
MSYPRNLKREKWTGQRVMGAGGDMAWERQVEAVHARVARFSMHRPSVTADASAWERHVRDVKARIRQVEHRS